MIIKCPELDAQITSRLSEYNWAANSPELPLHKPTKVRMAESIVLSGPGVLSDAKLWGTMVSVTWDIPHWKRWPPKTP